jgi:hypothetical protein
VTRTLAATLIGALALGAGFAAPAGARPLPPTAGNSRPGCPPAFGDLRSRARTEATRREATLSDVSAKLSAAQDPWGVNAGLLGALANAKNGLVALDQQIQTICAPTRDAIRTTVDTIFTGYRVYWLRVPQAHMVEEADHLGVARTKLGTVAHTLAGLVGSNTQAQADLTAMNQTLAAFDTTLGTVPTLTGHIADVPGLVPAADMSANVAAMQTARTNLHTARQSLGQASVDAKKVVHDLGH